MNRLLADDEVGASQESGGGFNSNYIPFSKLGPPARATGGRKGHWGQGTGFWREGIRHWGQGTGDRVLGTGYWGQGTDSFNKTNP